MSCKGTGEILLSIIVPSYNASQTIEKCITSLISQTMSPQQYEIIVINDGSTDETESLVQSLVEVHNIDNLTLVSKQNEGLPQARKSGIDVSKGRYIGFVDSDDWVDSDFFATLLDDAISHDADVAYGGLTDNYERYARIRKMSIQTSPISGLTAFEILNTRKSVLTYLWNKIFKRDLFNDVVFPKGNLLGEDYYVEAQLLPRCNCVVGSKTFGYHYMRYSDSMSAAGFSLTMKNGFYAYQEISKALIAKYPSLDRALVSYLMLEYMAILTSMFKNMQVDEVIKKWITGYVRSHLLTYLFYSSDQLKYKCSALVIAFNPSLYGYIYRRVRFFA